MAQKSTLDPKIVSVVNKFIAHIKDRGIPVKKTVIFGSWAKGKANNESDIDVCLVSSVFGKDEIAELQFLLKETRFVDDRLEPIPVSLIDFQNTSNPLIAEIKKTGLVI